MERIDQIEQQLKVLSAGVRYGIVVIIQVLTCNLCYILAMADKQQRLFDDLLKGKPLPPETQIVLEHSSELIIATIVVSAIATAILALFKQKMWCIPVGIFLGTLLSGAAVVVSRAYMKPLLSIMDSLA